MRYVGRVTLCVLALNCQNIWADEIAEKSLKILRKTVLVSQNLSSLADDIEDETSESGVETTSNINLFGKKIEVVKNSLKYRVNENEGLSYDNKFYVKGKKVLAESFVDGDGSYKYVVEIPYTEIAGDLFSYSFYVITLGINAGMSYEGMLQAGVSSELLRPNPSITPDMNLVTAFAGADLLAKGFIEGQVKILFIKGAVGGALNLIDGEAKASIGVTPMTITKPEVAYGGVVNLLSGTFYGYIGSGSTRWLSYDFYKYKGFCFAFGDSACQQN